MVNAIIISILLLFFVLSFYAKSKSKKRIRLLLFVSIFILFIVSAILTDKLYINLFFALLALIQLVKEAKKIIQSDVV